MIEIVIGILVTLATLFLGLSIEVVLGRNYNDRVGSTHVDFDLTGFEGPSEEVDLRLKSLRAKESEVDIDLFALEESPEET